MFIIFGLALSINRSSYDMQDRVFLLMVNQYFYYQRKIQGLKVKPVIFNDYWFLYMYILPLKILFLQKNIYKLWNIEYGGSSNF